MRFGTRVMTFPGRSVKKHARWTPIVRVWRHTVRATNDLETTIHVSPVNGDGQVFSLEMALETTLPIPPQDEHLTDQIEACVHRAGLEIRRKLFEVLIENADKELVLRVAARQRGRRYSVPGDTPAYVQDDLRRGDCGAVADSPHLRWHAGSAVGDRLEHVPSTSASSPA